MNAVTDYIDTIIAFFAFRMYYCSFLYVLTTHVTVCVCHTEIKGYLLTYLLTYDELGVRTCSLSLQL